MGLHEDLEKQINRLKFLIENLYTAINASSVLLFDINLNTIAECGGIDTRVIEQSTRDLYIQALKSLKTLGLDNENKFFILEAGKLGLYATPIEEKFILMAIVQNNIEIDLRKSAIHKTAEAIKKVSKNLIKYASALEDD